MALASVVAASDLWGDVFVDNFKFEGEWLRPMGGVMGEDGMFFDENGEPMMFEDGGGGGDYDGGYGGGYDGGGGYEGDDGVYDGGYGDDGFFDHNEL